MKCADCDEEVRGYRITVSQGYRVSTAHQKIDADYEPHIRDIIPVWNKYNCPHCNCADAQTGEQ
jgi:hypothetical protein|tara:strand:+ start:280 stop:471 length:192 start_codon:yes stop_codon:yes gene_type:complete